MAISLPVNIGVNVTPAVIVVPSGNNTTYQQFKQSLGNLVYYVSQYYVQSQNQSQIKGSFLYSKYDSSGNQNLQSIQSNIDPYQTQDALYVDTSEKNLIFDGRDFVRFNLLPNTIVQISLYSNRISNQFGLNANGESNFEALVDEGVRFDFLNKYKDVV
jgi:hypothetical protein